RVKGGLADLHRCARVPLKPSLGRTPKQPREDKPGEQCISRDHRNQRQRNADEPAPSPFDARGLGQGHGWMMIDCAAESQPEVGGGAGGSAGSFGIRGIRDSDGDIKRSGIRPTRRWIAPWLVDARNVLECAAALSITPPRPQPASLKKHTAANAL